MSDFDDIPEDREQTFPCDCGDTIRYNAVGKFWECDSCNFRRGSSSQEDIVDTDEDI